MEALTSRARTLCLHGKFGQAAKFFIIGGNSTRQQKTLIELEELHPRENKILDPMEDSCPEANQFDEAQVISQLQSFLIFTAAAPSTYPEYLLNTINCSNFDQSKQARNSLTKIVNLASRGQLPSFVAPVFCSATLTALKK